MLNYVANAKVIAAMAPHHRIVQAAIAVLANAAFQPVAPRGIFKYEGGVEVNGREIAIKDGYVIDDFTRPIPPSSEEHAVVLAIERVTKVWQSEGIKGLQKIVPPHVPGDPLRSFDLVGDPLRSFFKMM